jgi:hypothetical protein
VESKESDRDEGRSPQEVRLIMADQRGYECQLSCVERLDRSHCSINHVMELQEQRENNRFDEHKVRYGRCLSALQPSFETS